jgi:GDP/UDP-N,N'-diacetylbacillosamine 2-epimerase (hydrolysing)
LAEAPTFKIGTINIGDRQKGRLKAKSIIDCEPRKASIKQSIDTLYSNDFQNILPLVENPYGNGEATEKIMEFLRDTILPEELKKEFYNL